MVSLTKLLPEQKKQEWSYEKRTPSDNISDSIVNRYDICQMNVADKNCSLEQFCLPDDSAIRVDEHRNSRVRTSRNPNSIFDCTHNIEHSVLIWSCRSAEPSIICDIYEKLCAFIPESSSEPTERRFVTLSCNGIYSANGTS